MGQLFWTSNAHGHLSCAIVARVEGRLGGCNNRWVSSKRSLLETSIVSSRVAYIGHGGSTLILANSDASRFVLFKPYITRTICSTMPRQCESKLDTLPVAWPFLFTNFFQRSQFRGSILAKLYLDVWDKARFDAFTKAFDEPTITTFL